jgi:DNA-binding winged helix-turn-helix (wHTH) protein/tetratricopeptide (TPR) repeat protein
MNEGRFLEFDGFTVDLGQRLLSKDGRTLSLTPKAFETLAVLLESPGEVLGKEELLARVWPDSFVEEGILSQNVYTLRKVLAEAGGAGHYIETVPRRGYRFTGQVAERRVEEERAAGAETVASLAILPFEPWTHNPDDAYLGLGLADALVTRLSDLKRLAVRPTRMVRRYLGATDRDPVAIGRLLKVEAVLDGTIQRSGETLRLTVQLISVRDAAPLWAAKLDAVATDLFALEDSLSQKLADELKLHLTHQERDRLTQRSTRDPDAYQAYLRGRYFWNRRNDQSLERAIEYFHRAIALDPGYAAAFAGLADCYVLLPLYGGVPPHQAFPEAIAAGEKALALDGTLAEAHTSLAYARFFYDRRFAAAEEGFVRAIERNPGYPTAHHWFAFLLSAAGRHDEAVASAERALELDPLSLVINADLALVLYFGRRYADATVQFQKTLELDPAFAYAYFGLGYTLEEERHLGEAVAEFRRAVELAPESVAMLAALGHGLALSGEHEEARRILGTLTERSRSEYVDPCHFAFVLTALGDKQPALDRLEEACDERSRFIALLESWPIFDPLRGEPRFAELVKRAGLRAAARDAAG